MIEMMDNEVNANKDVDKTRVPDKETGLSPKLGSSNMHQSQEMVIPGEINVQESKPNLFSNGKNNNQVGTSRGMVGELTVKNFNIANLETISASKPSVWEDCDSTFFSEFLDNNQENEIQNPNQNNSTEDFQHERQLSPEGIRTKILSKSGFSKYFVKNTLKGKGVIFWGPAQDGPGVHNADVAPNSFTETETETEPTGVSLREWLKAGRNKVDETKNLYIFKQILDLVDSSHSRGLPLQALRPSCFRLLPSNEVFYLGSDKEVNHSGNISGSKKRKLGDTQNSFGLRRQFSSRSGSGSDSGSNRGSGFGYGFNDDNIISGDNANPSQMVSFVGGDLVEEQWYASPEDIKERGLTLASNIYSLGVLLFELLGSFESARAHAVAMMDLHQRILPPGFLSENPKEAGYCLWLIHPEAALRPTIRDVLQSDLVSGVEEVSFDDLLSSVAQEDAESELLLHFLTLLKEQKQKCASKLIDHITLLESDISAVVSRRKNKNNPQSREFNLGQSRLINNTNHLESAYFSVRSNIHVSEADPTDYIDLEVLKVRENNGSQKLKMEHEPLDRLGIFFSGLCKYARYSKFEVQGTLRNGDFSNSANVICSLGFDRDEDYFATAGVSKKIKIYDFHALLDDSVDVHCPAVEMSNKSKLSCICWNGYIKNYLASTDNDGVVKLWDAGTGQAVSHHFEHDRRAWSVDFSQVDPIKLASGSDDCTVKLWSINEKNSLKTIKTIANVCCVQFSPYSTHLLSFGSADYQTYCYDLRNISIPLCILAGHERAVSYVKFLDSVTLVSASTDNTLKLWDFKKTSFGALSTDGCTLTFKGHTNKKNFVGLSVTDGYIACGSETNEVYAYYRSLPMPITSHKFGSIDPISGKETDNENNQFVSSVCWRQKSEMVVAANSSGCLKLLQMV